MYQTCRCVLLLLVSLVLVSCVPLSAPSYDAYEAVEVRGLPQTQMIPESNEPIDRGNHTTDVTSAVRSVAPSATVGAVVLDRETDSELVAANPDRPFRSASLVKLLIALDVLPGASPDTRREVSTMLSYSNDKIASSLWVARGGASIVTRMSNLLALRGTTPPVRAGRWGDTLLTARDVVLIYKYVLERAAAADRDLILDALAGTAQRAADGWDQYFGIPYGLGGHWAIKQGWSSSDGNKVTHSTGLVGDRWRYVVVLLTECPLGVSWSTATESVTAGAAALAPVIRP